MITLQKNILCWDFKFKAGQIVIERLYLNAYTVPKEIYKYVYLKRRLNKWQQIQGEIIPQQIYYTLTDCADLQ